MYIHKVHFISENSMKCVLLFQFTTEESEAEKGQGTDQGHRIKMR